jgi:hypothetical protein
VLVPVLIVVVGLVVLGVLAALTSARARRFGRARARLADALAAGVRAIPALRRPAGARGPGGASEPDVPVAR